jgi:predicted ATPase
MILQSPSGVPGTGKAPFSIASIELNDSDGTVIAPSRVGVTAIVGGNNTGKSTLLYQINQWLHSQPLETDGQHPFRIVKSLALDDAGSQNYSQIVQWLDANAAAKPGDPGSEGGESYHRPDAPPVAKGMVQHIVYGPLKNGNLGELAPHVVRYTDAAGSGISYSPSRRARPGDPAGHPKHYIEDDPSIREEVDALMREVFGIGLTLDKLGNSVVLRVGTPSEDVPPPGYFDDARPFREELDKLSTVESQGDGVKAFLSKLLPIVTAAYPIVIIDEPEAFLHPPQAFKMGEILGRVATKNQVQVILATHDRNIILGLLKRVSHVG